MLKTLTIFKASLLEIRNEWSWYLILMTIQPLSLLFFVKILSNDTLNFEAYIIGSVIMIFGTGVFLSLGQTFSLYRQTSALDYYMSLPVSKTAIILSLVIKNVILSLPSLGILLLMGSILYSVNVFIGFPFLLAFILTSLSLAGLGTMIGVLSKNMQVASILTQVLTPIFTYLAPVFVEHESQPRILYYISYLFPTTYAANSLRAALIDNIISFD